MVERLIDSKWAQVEAQAIQQGDLAKYYEVAINRRMTRVLAIAKAEQWDSWKRNAVCKYMRKMLQDMSQAELTASDDGSLEDMVDHAAEGFDRWRARRLR